MAAAAVKDRKDECETWRLGCREEGRDIQQEGGKGTAAAAAEEMVRERENVRGM